jgi:hypothetical protein
LRSSNCWDASVGRYVGYSEGAAVGSAKGATDGLTVVG